ncbi:hypothetical protein MUN82_07840 [Hymenobacter aerilatus]|uniref:Uncharacterized protein n=1 Tax=Hymenobacter aerilatus TaxID=2932251 RepID=A0A8T9T552_9BACT|nr:hypothetical protein [Hymenobacter aerilatus]UOR06999.1 hypothetical protein MUN82_07840 [Hymenobacter aerilatus]
MFYRYLLGGALLTGIAGCAHHNTFFQRDARVLPPPTSALPPGTDSVLATAGRHYQRSGFHNLFFGKHYRQVWATPVRVPVLNPANELGGLTFEKRGGGFQTISATLESPTGREYALRTLDKDPYQTLPKVLRHTFVLTLVRDATSAANPYAALTVPPLAQAAGIPHTHPRIFYVPRTETNLGTATDDMQGKLVMLEEKFNGEENLTPDFGDAIDLVDTDEVLAQRFTSPTYQIDQIAFARARLLDILIGDWDRHEGQWRWAEYKQNGRTIYRPVPKDRDQVYFRFDDGVIPWLMSRKWAVRKFRTFRPRYEDIPGTVRNAHFLDTRALPEITAAQFQQLAADLQKRLTDSVITEAVRQMPLPIYALEGDYIAKSLRARREALPDAAREFYQLLAKHVEVVGTDEPERFVLERLSDSTTRVSVYRLPQKKKQKADPQPYYQRTFRTQDTKTITFYGLRGEDEFVVRGNVNKGIRLNIRGGPNEDTVIDSSRVGGWGKKTFYYDTKRGNNFTKGPSTADRRRRGVSSHAYDREGY